MKSLFLTVVLLVASIGGWASSSEVKERIFDACFLYADDQGVWVGEPLYAIGMIGTCDTPPVQVDPALADKLMPLVTRIQPPPKDKDRGHALYWWGQLPEPEPGQRGQAVAMLFLETQERVPKQEATENIIARNLKPNVIISARVRSIEFITPAWREDFANLDKGLKQIVELSLSAPGAKKQAALAAQVESCSQLLQRMYQIRPTQEDLRRAGQVDPKAQIVRRFQRRIEREWGGWLKKYAARLAIVPQTPLLPEEKPFPGEELVLKSTSSTDLLRRGKAEWPEEILEERICGIKMVVPYEHGTMTTYRSVFYRDIEAMTQAEYDALRRGVQEQITERRKYSQRNTDAETTSPQAIEQWGVRVQRADAKVLAQKQLLGGTLVVDRLPGEPKSGLEPGDIILGYSSNYELAMGMESSAFHLAQNEGKIKVLRGEQMIEAMLPKRKY